MLPNIHHASTEQTASDRPDLTLYASLELSRATWLVTCLLPERDRMSKYSTPQCDQLPRRIRPARPPRQPGRQHHPATRLRRPALAVRPGPVAAQSRLSAMAELPRQHQSAVLRDRRLRHRQIHQRCPRPADDPLRDGEPVAARRMASQARHLLRGNRRAHPGALPADPGRGHAGSGPPGRSS
jgi:hypothetical protein